MTGNPPNPPRRSSKSAKQEISEESVLTERMRALAAQAHKLSLKYDLDDEVRLIQAEEQKLQQFMKYSETSRSEKEDST